MNSKDNTVRQRIKGLQQGSIFFPNDFYDLASPEAVRKTLSRMATEGEIFRLSNGIYCCPRSNKTLGIDFIAPTAEEIAFRIAERDKVKIIPTGDSALNQIGLSTQIPGNAVYITNGARKKIKLWNGTSIIFKESNELRIFDFVSQIMMLIVSAMRSIGEDNITQDMLRRIKTLVMAVPDEIYRQDLLLAPVWIRKKLDL